MKQRVLDSLSKQPFVLAAMSPYRTMPAPSLAPSPDPRRPIGSFGALLEMLPPPAIPLPKRGRDRTPSPQRMNDENAPYTPHIMGTPTSPPPLKRHCNIVPLPRTQLSPDCTNIASRVLRFE